MFYHSNRYHRNQDTGEEEGFKDTKAPALETQVLGSGLKDAEKHLTVSVSVSSSEDREVSTLTSPACGTGSSSL